MVSEDLMKNILEYFQENQQATMYQLANNVRGFKGDFEWYLNFSTIIYSECSIDAIKIMICLMEGNILFPEIVSSSVYLDDGFIPIYPLAKSIICQYKDPHWIPMKFSKLPSWPKYRKIIFSNFTGCRWSEPIFKKFPEIVKNQYI